MGERTQYTPGTFSWTDLSTTDQDAAKAFYSGLFGWEANDMPAGEGVVYSMMQIDGKDVAAIAPQQQEQREAGVPPMWQSYVTVESADAALERAKELGATVHAPAFDVLEAGRMGVVQDPQGAYFIVWEPKRHIGAGLVNVNGGLTWNELATPDLDAAAEFYGGLFGWSTASMEGPIPYLVIRNGESSNGGITHPQPPGVPPHWLVYFGIEDLDAGLAKVAELGGKALTPAIAIGMGRIGVVQDPQGAVFALFEGELDP
jgi:predicted enzyme related to lactoylglutathione lyase